MSHRQRLGRVVVALALVTVASACEPGPVPATPAITPGTAGTPREVNIIARDWSFQPPVVDMVPGETVLFHVINGGLETHEAVIGNQAVQDAWEAAEAQTVGHPPGPTPVVSVPPEVAGLRLVVGSGQRADATWTVPTDVPAGVPAEQLIVGCHIPGHWKKGMMVPIRLVRP
jgi:uncharacterized cupredoxin-like copper-binding protein